MKELTKREQVVIATKVFNPMSDTPNEHSLSRKQIFDSIDALLRRLQTDYVDLYQIHRWDDETPIQETLSALHNLVGAGNSLISSSIIPELGCMPLLQKRPRKSLIA